MMRNNVIELLRECPDGLTTSEIRGRMGIADSDKSAVQRLGGTLGALNDLGVISKLSGRWILADDIPTQGGTALSQISDTDTMMCLRSHSGQATKTHRFVNGRWETEGYAAGYRFDAVESSPMSGIRDLSKVVTKLEGADDWMVIRGRLKSGEQEAKGVLRRMKDQEGDEPACFEPCDRRWIFIDIDHALGPWDGEVDHPGLEGKVRWAIKEYLPEPFHDVSFHYQWSSSAGLKGWDELSLHAWFWSDRPVCGESLKRYFKGREHPDTRPFNAVQVHYTAAPVFDGCEDPIKGERSGLVELGFNEVSLPPEVVDLETWEERQKRKRERQEKAREKARYEMRGRSPVKAESGRVRYAQKALEKACDNIMSSSPGIRHDTLFKESASIGGLVGSGYLDKSKAVSYLEEAGRAVYVDPKRAKDVARIVEDGMSRGTKDPRDLSHINDARRPTGPDASRPRREGKKKRKVTPHFLVKAEINLWPPMVRRKWHRRAAVLEEEYQGKPGAVLLAQLVATSELRKDGGTLPPYMLPDGERYYQKSGTNSAQL